MGYRVLFDGAACPLAITGIFAGSTGAVRHFGTDVLAWQYIGCLVAHSECAQRLSGRVDNGGVDVVALSFDNNECTQPVVVGIEVSLLVFVVTLTTQPGWIGTVFEIIEQSGPCCVKAERTCWSPTLFILLSTGRRSNDVNH
jgi:hypothetical protein